MKNNELSSLRFLGCAFLVVTALSFQGCKSSGSGIKPDAATSAGNTAGSGGAAGEGGNGGTTTVAGSSGGHAQGGAGAGGTSAPETGTNAGSCPGAPSYCCKFSGGTEDTIVATCTGGKWTCPGERYLTQTTETSCCLPDGGTTSPVCVYGQVECRNGSSPCGGSVADGGTCAGDRYCCPTFGPTEPFPAPYCLGGRWVCPLNGSVSAGGTPGVCCLPDGGTAPTECVGDIIQCSPLLGGKLCDRADVGQD
jgi:hypothetical protein